MAEEKEDDNYERIPKADAKKLRDAQDELAKVRNLFPSKYRGKENDFFSEFESLATEVKELKNKDKSDDEKKDSRIKELETELETRTKEIESLNGKVSEHETAVSEAKAEVSRVTKWGHVNRISQMHNVYVDDAFINENDLDSFDMDGYDIASNEGVEKFSKDFFEKILEPAYKRQETALERVGGKSSSGSQPSSNGNQPENEKTGNNQVRSYLDSGLNAR